MPSKNEVTDMTVRRYNEINTRIHGESDNYTITLYYCNLARKIRTECSDDRLGATGDSHNPIHP